ncbi:uncharacterized protein TRIADDRAFT_58306 [Trichoplax adhaerens]|uniref:HotDog ACOT-type domain-containing protein n=2 Tax=Trichoplax adhaerens TaxID=10228 RepID=B3S1I9_TRIAD|nr:hypothetical protein TRIADDRAFT_58306 [Trichoplax adhaerens]EDV23551.1 hypothetical protein TRIADDRAFT_58306 [Trichoplax adhaerens]|eukprot:XP_002114461.1 hypothetical protein TRIADDRAFT_58306 [Trichoplax adhaerens]
MPFILIKLYLHWLEKKRSEIEQIMDNNQMGIHQNTVRWVSTSPNRSTYNQNDHKSDSIILARKILPADTNPLGIIHGGQTLQLAEQAGHIAATRHCYSSNNNNRVTQTDQNIYNAAYMARLDHMNFLQPIFVNEVAQARAEVVFVSQHSLAVEIEVTAEDPSRGTRRLTNRGIFWYVNFNKDPVSQQVSLAKVPPLLHYDVDKYQKCLQLYNQQKENRRLVQGFDDITIKDNIASVSNIDQTGATKETQATVAASESVLVHMVMPADCYQIQRVTGGCLMKLMDNVAAIVCIRHTKGTIATASINDIDFLKPVKMGNLITAIGRLTFTSTKSMEVQVQVIAEDIWANNSNRYVASSAFYNFVVLQKNDKVPSLILTSDYEKRLFEEGRIRYENRKKMFKKK